MNDIISIVDLVWRLLLRPIYPCFADVWCEEVESQRKARPVEMMESSLYYFVVNKMSNN